MQRHLDWEGTWNARDLGGLRAGGRSLRNGAFLRSENLHRLTPEGWHALHDHGVRTLVGLRNTEERQADPYEPLSGVKVVWAPLEEGLHQDPAFLPYRSNNWWATALYFQPFLEHWPERCAAALGAIAEAPPGGVLVHCKKGSDRTGLIVLALLAMLGVSHEDIVADYLLTAQRLATPRAAALGWEDDAAGLAAVYAREGTSAPDVLARLLREFDFSSLVRNEQIADLRRRFVK